MTSQNRCYFDAPNPHSEKQFVYIALKTTYLLSDNKSTNDLMSTIICRKLPPKSDCDMPYVTIDHVISEKTFGS